MLQKLDQFTGIIRSWGLLLYASLPANLALLNILDIKINNIAFRYEYLFAAILPLTVIFLLILERQRVWFLRRDFLYFRTFFSVFLILIITTSICGLSLLIRNDYILTFNPKEWQGVAKAFLMAIASLVVSSALFMTILTKSSNLPGVPKKNFIDFQQKLKSNLLEIVNDEIWLDNNENLERFISIVDELEKDLQNFIFCIEINIINIEFKNLLMDISNLKKLLDEIEKYFNNFNEKLINTPNELFKTVYFQSLKKIKLLKLEN